MKKSVKKRKLKFGVKIFLIVFTICCLFVFGYYGYKVYKNNQLLDLTTLEYEILFTFIRNRGQVLTRDQLYDTVEKNTGNVIENNTLTVYMKRLRDKLGLYNGQYYIETIRGVGYRLYGNE